MDITAIPQPLPQLATRPPADPAKLDAAAKDFEAVFASQMFGHMFSEVETDPWFGGGQAEDIYKSLLVNEYGKLIAERGGLGITESVKRQFLSMQEVE